VPISDPAIPHISPRSGFLFHHGSPSIMRFLRHLGNLLGEVWGFAREYKAWWIVPVIVLLLLVTLVIVSVSGVSPFIYSLF